MIHHMIRDQGPFGDYPSGLEACLPREELATLVESGALMLYDRYWRTHDQRFVEFLAPQQCAQQSCFRPTRLGVVADVRRVRYDHLGEQGAMRSDVSFTSLWHITNRHPCHPIAPDEPRWTVLPICMEHAHRYHLDMQRVVRPYAPLWQAQLQRSLLQELRSGHARLVARDPRWTRAVLPAYGPICVLTEVGAWMLHVEGVYWHDALATVEMLCQDEEQEQEQWGRPPLYFTTRDLSRVCAISTCTTIATNLLPPDYLYCARHTTIAHGLAEHGGDPKALHAQLERHEETVRAALLGAADLARPSDKRVYTSEWTPPIAKEDPTV